MRKLSKYMLLLCFYVSAINSIGCAFNDKNAETKIKNSEIILEESKKKIDERSAGELNIEDFKITTSGLPEANKYQLEIAWSASVASVSFQVNSDEPVIVKNEKRALIPIYGNREQSLMIQTRTSAGEIIKNLEFSIPKYSDYLFSGETPTIENDNTVITADRVFFEANSIVDLNGKSLTINAKQIFFKNNSKIFLYRDTAERESDLKILSRGGVLKLNAQYLIGKPVIHMFGANGMHGGGTTDKSDLTIEDAMQRIEGSNCALYATSHYSSPNLSPNSSPSFGGIRSNNSAIADSCSILCRSKGRTLQGSQGKDGMPGGNPGELYIRANADLSEFQAKVFVRPGMVGFGGEGQQHLEVNEAALSFGSHRCDRELAVDERPLVKFIKGANGKSGSPSGKETIRINELNWDKLKVCYLSPPVN